MRKILNFMFFVFFVLPSIFASGNDKVLCSTFPVYIITMNVMKDTGNSPELMIPANMGCPHDYTLTTSDMKKLAEAKVLVINGLGMEEFLGAPLKKANKKIKVINSSEEITDLIYFSKEDSEKHQENKKHKHHHEGINPHIFSSPRIAGEMAKSIAGQLSLIYPENKKIYEKNAQKYFKKLEKIALETKNVVKTLKNNKIVTQHGAFDYYARDNGLEIIGVIQAHGKEEPSASDVFKLIKKIKEQKAGAIFAEPQYPDKLAKKISEEAKIPFAVLDPCASGPENTKADYYEVVMNKNIETLKKVLGN